MYPHSHLYIVLISKANVEKDPVRLASRLKQIAFGKNTVGYDNYMELIPKYVYCCCVVSS